MPSWKDGESSSEEEDSVMCISFGMDEDYIPLPLTMVDCSFDGIEPTYLCNHGEPVERCVAFEGLATGRRFFACAEKDGRNCGVVHWIDPQWPISMENALMKLWDMYEDGKNDLVNANMESAFTIHHLKEEKAKGDDNYAKLVDDVQKLFDQQDNTVLHFESLSVSNDSDGVKTMEQDKTVVTLKADLAKKDEEMVVLKEKYGMLANLTAAQANVIRKLKFEQLKDNEMFADQRRSLQWACDDLLKDVEKYKAKLKGMEGILASKKD